MIRGKSKTLGLMKAKNKAANALQKVNCKLRRTRVKENKCLKNKKAISRLTRKLCKLDRERRIVKDRLRRMKLRNNKCFRKHKTRKHKTRKHKTRKRKH